VAPTLGELRGLRRLQLDHTALAGVLPTQLGGLTNLKSLFMHECARLSGTLPTQLGRLTALLHGVSFARTRISGTIPSELGCLSRLRQLWLVGSRLSGSIPKSFGLSMRGLHQLELHGNRLSGSLPSQLGLLKLHRCVLTAAQGPSQPRHGMRPVDAVTPDTNHFECPLPPALPALCVPLLACAEGDAPRDHERRVLGKFVRPARRRRLVAG
jgi:hypothetical protein